MPLKALRSATHAALGCEHRQSRKSSENFWSFKNEKPQHANVAQVKVQSRPAAGEHLEDKTHSAGLYTHRLLVVIAIIAILAAILFPSSDARGKTPAVPRARAI
jgi:hypothetical protein